MPPLNFPCECCGAMVSTIGLQPGVAPFCSGCGKTFPAAIPAPFQDQGVGRSSVPPVIGCAVVGMAFLVFAGAATMMFVSKGGLDARREVEREAQRKSANREQAAMLAKSLDNPDFGAAKAAWGTLAACDRADHEGTFLGLDDAYRATHAVNALSLLTGGMSEFYGTPGENSIARELVSRRGNAWELEVICHVLETYPAQVEEQYGEPAKAAAMNQGALRILQSVEPKMDNPAAMKRVGLCMERVRQLVPAEKQ